MSDNKKAIRSFVVLAVLFLALILNGIFALGSYKSNPSSAWVSSPAVSDGSYIQPDYVVLEMSGVDENGTNVTKNDNGDTEFYAWVNVGRINTTTAKDGYGVIKIKGKSSSDFSDPDAYSYSKTVEIKKGVRGNDSDDNQRQYSWYRSEAFSSHYKYWQISSEDSLEINEIVFVSSRGELMPSTVVGAIEYETRGGAEIQVYKPLADLDKSSTASRLVDEQHLFKAYSSMAKKYNFTTDEANVVNAILSFGNGDAEFVDSSSGVLGLELMFIGLSVFGVNTLGVRIIPYIFFLLTIGLVFAFGRRIFKDSDAGLIMAVVYALLGLGLSVGSVGYAGTIALFFSLLSLYFMYGFYAGANKYYFTKSKHDFKVGNTALIGPVLLSALSFALAFNCSVLSLLTIPAGIFLLVAGVVKVRKVHAFNDGVAEFEDEKIRNAKQKNINTYGSVAAYFLSYAVFTLVLTLLFYSIVSTSYIGFYLSGEGNLLGAISANLKEAFAGGGAGLNMLKWIVGGGSTLIYQGSTNPSNFTKVFLSTNTALQIISVAAFVYSTIMVIKSIVATRKEGNSVKELLLPYALLTAGALFCWLPLSLFGGQSIANYIFSSLFLVGFVPLAYKLLKMTDKPAFTVKGHAVMVSDFVLMLAGVLALIFFGIGYVLFAGIQVNMTAAKILFLWWLF